MPEVPLSLPPDLQTITSPLILGSWETLLQGHPDKDFVKLILEGIQFGFHIGFNYQHLKELKSRKKNMLSASVHPLVVDAYIWNEQSLGRVAHITETATVPWLHCSAFGVIPKKH